MKILNQVNYIGGLGADWWIGSGFKAAFEDLGHEFFWLTTADDLGAKLGEVRPDILMIAQDRARRRDLPALREHRRRGMKVVLRVDSFFGRDPEIREMLVKEDPADLYYGEVENPHMDRFTRETGKPYAVITNAAHQRLHKPAASVKKYECDIVFLGAMLPKKREVFDKLLFPLRKKYRVKIYGPGWTLMDGALRALGGAARALDLGGLNRWIQRMRITVPPGEEGQLYSSAKICLNLHERGPEANVILNERTFKVPACGGFELCDYVPELRNYFTEDEMAMADERAGSWYDDWFRKIGYYMAHDAERKAMQARGTARALRDHTYLNRVRQIFSLLRLS